MKSRNSRRFQKSEALSVTVHVVLLLPKKLIANAMSQAPRDWMIGWACPCPEGLRASVATAPPGGTSLTQF